MITTVLGIFDFLKGDDKGKSLEYYLKKLEDTLEEEFNTLVMISRFYADSGDVEEALGYLERAYKVASDLKDEELIAFTLDSMGDVYLTDRKVNTAMEYFREAFKIYSSVNSPLRHDLREKMREVEKIKEAMDIAALNRLQDETDLGRTLLDLQVITPLIEKLIKKVESTTLYESYASNEPSGIVEAYQIAHDIGDEASEASLLLLLAADSFKSEEYDKAEKKLKKSARIFRKLRDEKSLGVVLVILGVIAFINDKSDYVAANFREAVELFQKIDDRELESMTLELLNKLYSF